MPRSQSSGRNVNLAAHIAAGVAGGRIAALAAHVVYGATTELVRRGLVRAFTSGRLD